MQGRSLPSGERESRKVGSATGKAPPQSWTRGGWTRRGTRADPTGDDVDRPVAGAGERRL